MSEKKNLVLALMSLIVANLIVLGICYVIFDELAVFYDLLQSCLFILIAIVINLLLILKYPQKNLLLKCIELLIILSGFIGVYSLLQSNHKKVLEGNVYLLNSKIYSDSTVVYDDIKFNHRHQSEEPQNSENYYSELEFDSMLYERKVNLNWVNDVDSVMNLGYRKFSMIDIPSPPLTASSDMLRLYKSITELYTNNEKIKGFEKSASEINSFESDVYGSVLLLYAFALQLCVYISTLRMNNRSQ